MRWAIPLLLVAVSARAQPAGTIGGRDFFLDAVTREALAQGVPPEIADAVAMVETGYRPDARGSSGEVGLMQILPSTAAQLGFTGSLSDLFVPETNIHYAMQYLARAWSAGGGDICRALMKYRAGLGEEYMSPLSATYCTRAMAWLKGDRSLLAEGVKLPNDVPAVADPHVVAIGPTLTAQLAAPGPDLHEVAMPAPAPIVMNRIPDLPGVVVTPAHAYRTVAERNAALGIRPIPPNRRTAGLDGGENDGN